MTTSSNFLILYRCLSLFWFRCGWAPLALWWSITVQANRRGLQNIWGWARMVGMLINATLRLCNRSLDLFIVIIVKLFNLNILDWLVIFFEMQLLTINTTIFLPSLRAVLHLNDAGSMESKATRNNVTNLWIFSRRRIMTSKKLGLFIQEAVSTLNAT